MDTNGHIYLCEDYVSFETAKLLKEKGFNEDVTTFYNSNGKFEYCSFPLNHNLDIGSGFTSAPSQSLALKWLREVHNWYIDIRFNRHYQYYIPIVYNMSGTLESIANLEERPKQYEQAIEAALNYVLKNLI